MTDRFLLKAVYPSKNMTIKLTADQAHAFGIIGGVAFGMPRRALVKAAKGLMSLGLVTTGGAFSGHNRSAYHWELTASGLDLLIELLKGGAYPLARHTERGRQIMHSAGLL